MKRGIGKLFVSVLTFAMMSGLCVSVPVSAADLGGVTAQAR